MIGALIDKIPPALRAVICVPSVVILWGIFIAAVGLFAPKPKEPDDE